jgi:hypothetical protein
MHRRVLLLAPSLVGLSVLVSACDGSSSPKVSTQSAQANAALAFARCMRSHGVPNFPDPDAQGKFPSFNTGVSKQTSSAADEACRHVLPSGGTATPQQRQQKLEFGVKVAECLRAHGYPDFPDPTHLGQQTLPPGIDTNSPQFQTVETTCEKQAQKALGLP